MTDESEPVNQDALARYQTANVSFYGIVPDIELVAYCVDPSTFGPDFEVFYGYTNPATSWQNAAACYAPLSPPMLDATFNCTDYPRCVITCTGPNQADMLSATFQTGCETEWLFHSTIFRGFMSILIYICFNISRLLIVSAVCRMQWKALTGEGMQFQGNCSRTGKTTTNVKTMLKGEVETTIGKFEREAIVMFIIAMVVHLPYLVLMIELQH